MTEEQIEESSRHEKAFVRAKPRPLPERRERSRARSGSSTATVLAGDGGASSAPVRPDNLARALTRRLKDDPDAQMIFRSLLRTYDPEQDRPALVLLLHELARQKSLALKLREPAVAPTGDIDSLEQAAFAAAGEDGERIAVAAEAANRLREFVGAHAGDKCYLAAARELRLCTDDVRKYEEARAAEVRQEFLLVVVRVLTEVAQDENIGREEIATEVSRRLEVLPAS